MNTSLKTLRADKLAGAAAALAVAAMGFASSVQARDNISWSIGVGIPGTVVNVGNAGGYYPQPVYVQRHPGYVQQQPVYVQSRPIYVQPQPVFVQPGPIYYQPRPVFVRPVPEYLAPQPVYYGRPHDRQWRKGGDYLQNQSNQYGPGYGHVHYQRDGRHGRDDD